MWRGGGALRSDGFYAVMPLQARASTAFTAPLTEPITRLSSMSRGLLTPGRGRLPLARGGEWCTTGG